MGINLLPPKYRPEPLIKKNQLKTILLCCIVMILLLFGGIGYYFYRTGLEKDLAGLRAKLLDLGSTQTVNTSKRLADLQEKTVVNLQLWSSLFGDIALKMDDRLWITEINSEQEKLIIRGEANDLVMVGNFLQEINKLSGIDNVEVKFTEKIGILQGLVTDDEDIDLLKIFEDRKEIVLGEKVSFLLTAQLKEKWQLPFFEGDEL